MHTSIASPYTPGSLVHVRNRDWIVLPSEDPDILRIKPLGGAESEITGIYLPLGFPEDKVQPTQFMPPTEADLGDFGSARLLYEAARLSFRDVAGPFRSLGKLSFRPRAYQMVPLIMALRQQPEPIRLLIADDVGVGKTIEALLIVKELIERREIERFAVVCLPHLCEQWQQELKDKFGLEAVIIRSNTARRLDRELRGDASIFKHFPYQVISIDYIKADARRLQFIQEAPEMVIVDEAHTATRPDGVQAGQQQRHRLVHDLSAKDEQHLLLLTATPHSGKAGQFQSLLGLLKPEFAQIDLTHADRRTRERLARHFVQRRRADVLKWMNEDTPFPVRDTGEYEYRLSPCYREFYNDVLAFAKGLADNPDQPRNRQRLQFWTALALLRGVMSSPEAGADMLRNRLMRLEGDEPTEGEVVYPSNPVGDRDFGFEGDTGHGDLISQNDWSNSQREKLNRLAHRLENLGNLKDDRKAAEAERILSEWISQGLQPVVFCRYIGTAQYLGRLLREAWGNRKFPVDVQVVTSEDPDEVRRERIEAIGSSPRRLLVATDCLSEGINLQQLFTAVLHYDLPWNPNRLEQREGRVDRYGQTADEVKAYLLYGTDNPIDGTVLKVLLRKVREIRKSIGISIPFPEDSDSIMDAVLQAILMQPIENLQAPQLSFDFGEDNPVEQSERQATKAIAEAAEREKASRSIFAQHAIKAQDIEQDLAQTDQAIGDPATVERFVREALPRFFGVEIARTDAPQSVNHASARPGLGTYQLIPLNLPGQLRETLPEEQQLPVTFHSPVPEGYHYLGRNHLFVSQLCQYLLAQALDHQVARAPARAAVMACAEVQRRTVLVLFRVRMVIETVAQPKQQLVAEEMLPWGFTGSGDQLQPLSPEEVQQLLDSAQPVRPMSQQEQTLQLEKVKQRLNDLSVDFNAIAEQRAQALVEAHERFRQAMGGKRYQVGPVLPMDQMGVYVLLPG